MLQPKINEDIFCENKEDENDSLEEYDIDDMDEYASSEDEDHPKKQVPRWGERTYFINITLKLCECAYYHLYNERVVNYVT